METKLHKTERTPRPGLLSEAERDAIQNNRISRQLKWKLTDSKKGKLTIGLKALIEDFRIIFGSKELMNWSHDYLVIEHISELRRILSKEYSFHPIAIERLKFSRKKKVYRLDKIIVDEIPRSGEIGSFFEEKTTVGLKQNEKKFISKYQKKTGRHDFPLEREKEYSWKEVKQKLNEDLKQPDLSKLQKGLEPEARRRIDEAWKIYNNGLTTEDKQKITGLGVYFQAHSMLSIVM